MFADNVYRVTMLLSVGWGNKANGNRVRRTNRLLVVFDRFRPIFELAKQGEDQFGWTTAPVKIATVAKTVTVATPDRSRIDPGPSRTKTT